MEELKKSADEALDERMDASVKRILQQNRRMAEELKIHVQVREVWVCVWGCVCEGGGVTRGDMNRACRSISAISHRNIAA